MNAFPWLRGAGENVHDRWFHAKNESRVISWFCALFSQGLELRMYRNTLLGALIKNVELVVVQNCILAFFVSRPRDMPNSGFETFDLMLFGPDAVVNRHRGPWTHTPPDAAPRGLQCTTPCACVEV